MSRTSFETFLSQVSKILPLFRGGNPNLTELLRLRLAADTYPARVQHTSDPLEPQEEKLCQSKVPVWSAYNFLVNYFIPVTTVDTCLPLIVAPVHEWNTLIIVLKQTQGINVQVSHFTQGLLL